MPIRSIIRRMARATLVVCLLAGVWQSCQDAQAKEGRWKRSISYQDKNDLFANYQVGPNPSGTAAQMYVSPLPVPAFNGHTYTTYQPLMPHEYLYGHTRSHYAYTQGGGWSRSKIRYRTYGLNIQGWFHDRSNAF